MMPIIDTIHNIQLITSEKHPGAIFLKDTFKDEFLVKVYPSETSLETARAVARTLAQPGARPPTSFPDSNLHEQAITIIRETLVISRSDAESLWESFWIHDELYLDFEENQRRFGAHKATTLYKRLMDLI